MRIQIPAGVIATDQNVLPFKNSILERKIIQTSDGSHTLYVPELDEHYHSVFGAIQESELIFVKNGLDYCNASPVRIFEAGFGTGLNALLSAIYATTHNREVIYTSIEKFQLPESLINELNYKAFVGEDGKKLFDQVHSAGWNRSEKINGYFTLHKINQDLLTYESASMYDLIYFDAFGPDKQPEMWTMPVFRKIAEMTVSKGILVTYSVKGEVKRNLRDNGFEVSILPGPPGKRHVLRAVKI